MYYEYFGLTEDPFSSTPNPKYTFLSERYRKVLAHLVYGVTDGGGLVQLTGEVGTGKTTLCRNLLFLQPDELNIALIFNSRQPPLELMASLCDELHISYPHDCSNIKVLVDRLNAYLLESHSTGQRTILIIDEAQNLSFDALEQIRLLTNLETAPRKLLQIILVGQPKLHSLLEQPELRQLAQRISARYHLIPLNPADTRAYVHHRLEVAGYQRRLFTAGALRQLHELTGGVPRLINVLCGRAMLAAYGKNLNIINRRLLRQVAQELTGRSIRMSGRSRWAWGLAGLLSIALGLSTWWALDPESLPEPLRQLPLQTASTPAISSTPPPVKEQTRSAQADTPQTVATRHAVAESEDVGSPEAKPESVIPRTALATVIPIPESDPKASPSPVQSVDTAEPSITPDSSASPASLVESTEPASLLPRSSSPAVEASDSQALPDITTAEPPAPVPEPVAQTIANALNLVGEYDDIANAFTTLFGYWQSDYPLEAEGSPCEKAARIGLQCLFGRGNWDNLHFYNRPAVVELLLDRGKRYHMVVSALNAEQVTLDFGARQVKVAKCELEPLWSGSYIVLWRPPKLVGSEYLQPESQGPDVHWLREMLERVDGQPTGQLDDLAQARYDWQLVERVMTFQRTMGLVADGIVGRQTQIKLNAAVNDSKIPVLDRGLENAAQSAKPMVSSLDEAPQLTKTQQPPTANPPVSKSEVRIKPTLDPTASPEKTSVPQLLEATTMPASVPIMPAKAALPVPLDAKPPTEDTIKHDMVPVESSEPVLSSSKPAESLTTATSETPMISAPTEREEPVSEPVLAHMTPAVAMHGMSEPDEWIPQVKELPKAVQHKFDNLEINIHFYHEIPEARFVMIGKRRYREGDVLDQTDLKLERITREWVIIDYGKGRVRL